MDRSVTPETQAPPPPAGYLPVTDWRYWEVLVVFFSGAFGSLFVVLLVVASGTEPLSPLPFSLIFGAQAAFSFGAVWFLSRSRGSGSLAADVGLVVKLSDWWAVFAGMGLQIAIVVVTGPIIVFFWPEGPPTQGVAEIAAASETLADQLAVLFAVVVGAPIIEEIIFRGMLLSILRKSFSKWTAIVVAAAIFSSVHLLDPNAIAVVPGLFLLGVILGWAALRRGDLSLAIALHSGLNLLAAISLLYGPSILEWADVQLEQVEAVVRLFA